MLQLGRARVVVRLGRELQPKLRPVINATGIVLHTNLGRAPVAEQAAKAAYEAARGHKAQAVSLQPAAFWRTNDRPTADNAETSALAFRGTPNTL